MEGKIVCITGASKGIGAEICIKLANVGCIVIGLARGVDRIDELSKRLNENSQGKIIGRKCDVEVESEMREAFNWIRDKFGQLDVFINNAGVMKSEFLIEDKTENFRKSFDVNVIASCVCLREAVNLMKETTRSGQIIIMNSILGHRIPDIPYPMKPSFGVYPATKHALTAICQTLRQELSYLKLPIRITSISPGMVDSEMLNCMNSELVAILPKLKVEDIAEAFCMLLEHLTECELMKLLLIRCSHKFRLSIAI